jgi:hypothetical protein
VLKWQFPLELSLFLCTFAVEISNSADNNIKNNLIMVEILELFDYFDSDIICVKDFGIVRAESLITHIALNDKGEVTLWSGNPQEDKYADEIILSKEERRLVFEEILEHI